MKLEVTSPSTNFLALGAGVPLGQTGLVHIWGRNDEPTPQKLGIRWWVKDPDGIEVQDYSDWEFGGTSPGAEHEFLGPRFDFDKRGVWTILVFLFIAINGDRGNPTLVDSYDGDLCSIPEVPVPPEEKKFPWAPVAIGAGAVVAVIGLAAAAKKGVR